MIGQFFYMLIMLAVVAVLAYFCTKWLAAARRGALGKKNLQVLESCALGAHNSIQLVKIGGKHFLLGVTKEQVSLLAEIPSDQLQPAENTAGVFDKILGGLLKNQR